MQLQLRDFRCFHQPEPVPIRPINLLVGENSAGKTSFLAAMRFTLEFLKRTSQASFNKDPFHLGAFEQIAHYRGGRFGRAKTFSFELTHEVPKATKRQNQLEMFADRADPTHYSIRITFHDFKSQSALQEIDFRAGRYGFRFVAGENMVLHVQTPSVSSFKFSDAGVAGGRFDFIQDVASYADFLLRDLRYLVNRSDAVSSLANAETAAQFFGDVEYLSDLYRRVQRSLPHNIYASAPVRSKPERTYNVEDSSVSADGGHIPFILAQLNSFDPEKWHSIEKAIGEFGKSSGLFNKVQVKRIGANASGPFQIIVSLTGNRSSNIVDVGYGVSQSLPIIADTLRLARTMFLFQQPEVHLHPKAQAELGTFFAAVAKERGHTFFIETHSDYLLDRIRMEVRSKKRVTTDDVSILYFEKCGHDVKIHPLTIDRSGNILGAPAGYRKFFLEEEVKSLGIELT